LVEPAETRTALLELVETRARLVELVETRARLVELVETPDRGDRCGLLAGRGGDEERRVWWR
jgi:hypothetical protein